MTGYGDPPVHLPRRKAVNASKLHDSTGSTASTFITQTEYSGAEASEDIIPDLMSDLESDEDVTVHHSLSDSDSDDQISIPQESEADRSDVETLVGSDSDSDDAYPKEPGPHKRIVASSSSDSSSSDSEQDTGKKASKAPSTRSSVDSDSSFGKDSAQSSSKDSGLGTSLDTKTSAQTKSTDESDQGMIILIFISLCLYGILLLILLSYFRPTYEAWSFCKFHARLSWDCILQSLC